MKRAGYNWSSECVQPRSRKSAPLRSTQSSGAVVQKGAETSARTRFSLLVRESTRIVNRNHLGIQIAPLGHSTGDQRKKQAPISRGLVERSPFITECA